MRYVDGKILEVSECGRGRESVNIGMKAEKFFENRGEQRFVYGSQGGRRKSKWFTRREEEEEEQ